MRVLEKGKGWSLEVTCTGSGNGDGGCGAKLLIEKEDVFQTSSGSYDGDTSYFTTIKCIQCEVLTDLPRDVVPSGIRNHMPDKKTWEGARSQGGSQ